MMKNQFFFIVGAQRCGTTYLTHLLNQHPNIQFALPLHPEPKFFINENAEVNNFLKTHFIEDDQKYCLGEKSTSYIESAKAAVRIKSKVKDPKIIISLRNPIERTLSNYFFSKKNKIESRTLEEVFINNIDESVIGKDISVNPYDYLRRSQYEQYISKYIEIFGIDNIHFIKFENLKKSSQNEINKIFSFLNLKIFDVDIDVDTNKSKRNVVSKEVILFLTEYLSKDLIYFNSIFNN